MKLDQLIGVIAASRKQRDAQIAILTAAGCDSGFIGAMPGITPGTVRMDRSRRRSRTAPGDAVLGDTP